MLDQIRSSQSMKASVLASVVCRSLFRIRLDRKHEIDSDDVCSSFPRSEALDHGSCTTDLSWLANSSCGRHPHWLH